MPDEIDFTECASFIAEARARGLRTVVVAWQQEYGQDLGAHGVVYDRLAHFTLLAYHKPTSTILRCPQQGDAAVRATTATQLRAAGFTVEERDRNEVKFRT
jgi:outer membrane PBP1 activator LpoA protein